MKGQLDPGKGPVADLPSDLVEAHPAADDQLLDGAFVFAHGGGEPLQRREAQEGAGLLILGASFAAPHQAVEAEAQPRLGHLVLTAGSGHVCNRGAVKLHSNKNKQTFSPQHFILLTRSVVPAAAGPSADPDPVRSSGISFSLSDFSIC